MWIYLMLLFFTIAYTLDMMAFIQAYILYHTDLLNHKNTCDVSTKTW